MFGNRSYSVAAPHTVNSHRNPRCGVLPLASVLRSYCPRPPPEHDKPSPPRRLRESLPAENPSVLAHRERTQRILRAIERAQEELVEKEKLRMMCRRVDPLLEMSADQLHDEIDKGAQRFSCSMLIKESQQPKEIAKLSSKRHSCGEEKLPGRSSFPAVQKLTRYLHMPSGKCEQIEQLISLRAARRMRPANLHRPVRHRNDAKAREKLDRLLGAQSGNVPVKRMRQLRFFPGNS